MFGVRLFPPQVLSDLNFFNVKSEKQLASRLRAVQRVAVAAIGAYFFVRYEPILAAKLGSSWVAGSVVDLAFYAGYGCLSHPAAILALTGVLGYQCTMNTLLCNKNRERGLAVIGVGLSVAFYMISQLYRSEENGALEGPNFLERLFQKVEDKLTQPLWNRFYKNEEV